MIEKYGFSRNVSVMSVRYFDITEGFVDMVSFKVLPGQTIIPYTVWGGTNKVAIRVKSFLEFHNTVYGAPPIKTADSSWVNYILENEAG